MYDKHKEFINYYLLISNNPLIKINCIIFIISILYYKNKIEKIEQIKKNLDKYKITKKILNRYGKKIEMVFIEMENIKNVIEKKDFKILKNEKNDIECLICINEIKKNTTIIKCNKCNKKLGHYICLIKWIIKNKCIICRK